MTGIVSLVIVIVLFFAAIGALYLIAWKLGLLKPGVGETGSTRDLPYRALSDRDGKPCGVLTPGEQVFFAALRGAVSVLARELGGPEPLLLAKVRLADLIEVAGAKVEGDRSRRATAQNKINSKHADFVLCHPETTRPLLVIELDDRSHARADRGARDEFVDAACAAAGLPVLHVPAAAGYDARALAGRIAETLGPAPVTAGQLESRA